MNTIPPKKNRKLLQVLLLMVVLFLSARPSGAQSLSERYTKTHPVVIACDWDKPPYEFLDDNGRPAGTNVDILTVIMERLGIPCKFVMKEWTNAIKTFERNEADLIFSNRMRFRGKGYVATQVINYDRICVATTTGVADSLTMKTLEQEGFVLKSGDYTVMRILGVDSAYKANIEYQSPNVALRGLQAGDNKYFVWGEEPLRWKIRELNLTDVSLTTVDIPINKVHLIGRDKELIDRIDDQFSRLKQSGEQQQIIDRWLHPDQVHSRTPPYVIYVVVTILLLAILVAFLNRLVQKLFRKAIRRSSELNNMMMKALQLGNFSILQYNIKADRMTNRYDNILPAKGLTFKQFTSRIHPDQREEFLQNTNRLLTGRSRHFELDTLWNAGTDDKPHWLNFNGYAILELDTKGRPAYIVNAIHNVTHQVEEDRAAYERDCCYNTLTNLTTIAISFYSSDGWLLELNDMMKEICGFDSDPDAERYWNSLNMFYAPQFRELFTDETWDGLHICQHMVHSDVGVDKFIEFSIVPLYDAQQTKIINYFVGAVDVTKERNSVYQLHQLMKEEKRTIAQTGLQKEWLTYLLNNSRRYIMRSNIASQRLEFFRSPEGPIMLYGFEEFCDILEEAEREPFHHLVNDTTTRTPQQVTIHVAKLSGKQLDVEPGFIFNITFVPLLDSQGNIIGHHGVASDITKFCNARQELVDITAQAKDSNKLKSGFMASMTHELRTPLNAIVGFTGVLEALGDSPERSEYVRIIRNSSDMLQRLINDIIEASNLNKALTASVPDNTDFAAAFDDICMTLRQRIPDGIVFINDNPFQTLPAVVDTARIQQVITNLVTNAVKFTSQGHIRVGYRIEERTVGENQRKGLYIYCEDTGIGIPKDKQKLIFERFVKLNEFVQGTGMGLAISKSIVERCGGLIGVDSEGENRGSTFWIWIPCELG